MSILLAQRQFFWGAQFIWKPVNHQPITELWVPGEQHKGLRHFEKRKKLFHSLALALTLTLAVTPSPSHLQATADNYITICCKVVER